MRLVTVPWSASTLLPYKPLHHMSSSRRAYVAGGAGRCSWGPATCSCRRRPVSFDASVQELFHSLACNGKLLLAAPGGEKDTQYLAQLCKEKRVTCCSFVPSQLDVLLQACANCSCAFAPLISATVY